MSKVTYADPTVEFDHAVTTPSTPRAYRAHLYDESGTLAQVNGIIYFVADTGTITPFTPTMTNFCVTLGEVVTSEMQTIYDRIAGGPARIACTRQEGRT